MLKWRFWIWFYLCWDQFGPFWLLCAAAASYSDENSCGFAFSYRVAVQTLQIRSSDLIIEHQIEATSTSIQICSLNLFFFSTHLAIFVHTQMTFQARTTFFWDVQQSHSSVNFVAFYTVCTKGSFFLVYWPLKAYLLTFLLSWSCTGKGKQTIRSECSSVVSWGNCLLPSSGLVALFEWLCLCRRGRGYFVKLLSWEQDKRRAKTCVQKNICTTSSPSSTLQSSVWCVGEKVLLQKWVMPLLSTPLCSCTVLHSVLY